MPLPSVVSRASIRVAPASTPRITRSPTGATVTVSANVPGPTHTVPPAVTSASTASHGHEVARHRDADTGPPARPVDACLLEVAARFSTSDQRRCAGVARRSPAARSAAPTGSALTIGFTSPACDATRSGGSGSVPACRRGALHASAADHQRHPPRRSATRRARVVVSRLGRARGPRSIAPRRRRGREDPFFRRPLRPRVQRERGARRASLRSVRRDVPRCRHARRRRASRRTRYRRSAGGRGGP